VRSQCAGQGYVPVHVVAKAGQLREALTARTGAILLGESGGGKSVIAEALAAALGVTVERIFPKALVCISEIRILICSG
jgi:MoxR-like ATPase